jgi:hypothetical protein
MTGAQRACRRALRWIVLGAALASSGCAYSIVRNGTVDESAVMKIEHGLAKIRQLPFVSPVPVEVKSPEDLRSYLEAELAREYSPGEIQALQRVYQRLGLLPPQIDLGEALLKLYSAQVAGLYDPQEGKMFLVPSGVPSAGWAMAAMQFVMRRDLVNEMLLAHELTHALQDQHFGILSAADDASNDDHSLAMHAVIEGDATLAGFAYVLGGLPESSLLDLVQRLDMIPAELEAELPDTPPILRDSLVFQYSAGARFVALAYLRSGWPGVNALLAHPPTSTEQILWPEKYFGKPDSPMTVNLGGLEDYRTGKDWSLIEENTLGALSVRILFEGFQDREQADRVARGWDGDRLAAFSRGDEVHLFWLSTWDDETAAREFFAAESGVLAAKYPDASRTIEQDRIAASAGESYRLERRGDKVLLVLGVPAVEIEKRSAEIWKGTTVSPTPIQVDFDLARRP